MRRFVLVWLFFLCGLPVEAAPKVKTPYEAVVDMEEVTVRSGPGSSQYYPTGKLRRGDKVIVHRHDLGGWYMIAPPPGSFSWVPAKYVRKLDDQHGVISRDKVAVRVGSHESDIHELYQRVLVKDDEVRILGEKMLRDDASDRPGELWYRIAPPPNEWRWIPGQAVVPLTASSSPRAQGHDPFVAPEVDSRSRGTPQRPGDEPTFEQPQVATPTREYSSGDLGFGAPPETARESRPLVRKGGKAGTAAPENKRATDLYADLDRLDTRFQAILDGPILDWDFDQLERDYIALRAASETQNLSRMVDSRLDRITNYRKAHDEEVEIVRIREETTRRDQELAELQRKQESMLVSARPAKYDGAGIIARAALNRRGAPRYALLNPKGRVLAYLVPASGVDLERWVGRAVGVTGPRFPNSELRADVITVNRLTPVQLSP
jgi:hypothetical protein